MKAYLFWSVAFLASIYWGLRGAYITFNIDRKNWPMDLKVIQFLFNFIGSFLGWLALYYFQFQVQRMGLTNLEWKDFAALFVAFIGINGHLPYVAVRGHWPKP